MVNVTYIDGNYRFLYIVLFLLKLKLELNLVNVKILRDDTDRIAKEIVALSKLQAW